MALNLVSQNGFTFVEGAYRVTTTNRPVLLGAQASSAMVGGHAVGVDAPFDTPVYVRAYGDATKIAFNFGDDPLAWARGYDRVGYTGFLQARVLGAPVPPNVVGGDIGRLQGYSAGREGDHWTVMFMDPGNALARMPDTAEPPFFAYNAMLVGPRSRIEDFGSFGAETGSLFLPAPPFGLRDPMLGPSMLAQVNAQLLTERDVIRMVRPLQPLLDITVSAQDAATTPLYILTGNAIRNATGNRWIREVDRGITLADLSRIRLAGRYMLMNVANGEHLEPVLCARLRDTDNPLRKSLRVHLLDYDHLRGAEERATARLVNSAVEALQNEGRELPFDAPVRTGRGRTGLLERPMLDIPDGTPLLRVRVAGVVFGRRRPLRSDAYPAGMHPHGGFEVELRWRYDAETRILVYDGAESTRQLFSADDEHRLALRAYEARLGQSRALQDDVDVSAFTLIGTPWASPDPSAPRPVRRADWEDADEVVGQQ